MISQNFLFYSIGIGFLVLVGFLSWASFSLSKTLRKLTSILEKINDVVKDADDLKNYAKSGILYLINMFVKKAGDKHGKEK